MKLKDIVVGFPWVCSGHNAHSDPLRLELKRRGVTTLKYSVLGGWGKGKKMPDSLLATIARTNLTVENYHSISHLLGKHLPKPIIHLPHGTSIWKYGKHVGAIDYNLSPSKLWDLHYKILEGNRVKNTYLTVGLPKLDSLIRSLPNRDTIRAGYIKKLKLNPNNPIVAFLPTWYSEGIIKGVGTLLELEKIDFNSIENFVVAPHTSDYNEAHPRAKKIVDSAKYKCLDTNKDELLLSADIIVGDISSMLIESLVVDRPIVHIHKNNMRNFCIGGQDDLGMLLLGSLVEIGQLKNAIHANSKIDNYKELRKFWKDRLLYMADGNSTSRAADKVIEIINKDILNV